MVGKAEFSAPSQSMKMMAEKWETQYINFAITDVTSLVT